MGKARNIADAESRFVNTSGDAMTGQLEMKSYLRITDSGGTQKLLIGNQDSGGVNKPAILSSGNANFSFGYGNSWTGDGGTFTEIRRITPDGQVLSVIPNGTTLYPEVQCRAWVNFNGQGTPTIRASGNISSITDEGTGVYSLNFATHLPNANYAALATLNGANVSSSFFIETGQPTRSVSQIGLRTQSGSGNADFTEVNVAVFR